MKGNKKLLDALNARLSEELGAINQYMVHAEMWRTGATSACPRRSRPGPSSR